MKINSPPNLVRDQGIYSTKAGSILTSAGPAWDFCSQLEMMGTKLSRMLLVVFTLFAVLAAASDDTFDYGATDGNWLGPSSVRYRYHMCKILLNCMFSIQTTP